MNTEGLSFALAAPRSDSFVHSDSALSVQCAAAFETVAARLQAKLAANGLSIVHVHEVDRALHAAGTALGFRCRVYEVCDANQVAELLALDPALAPLFPWRIALTEGEGGATVATPRPVFLLTEFSPVAAVAPRARSLEARLQRVLREIC